MTRDSVRQDNGGIPGSYEVVAAEYYDSRHITSRNFDLTTASALLDVTWQPPDGLILEPGCGRGRVGEFLGVDTESRVVQLDNSSAMLQVEPREPALLQILHDAEELPFPDGVFSSIVALLCDGFLGLNFLAEASRVLSPKGCLFGTTPSLEWASALRDRLGLDLMTTRFLLRSGESINVPSAVYGREQLTEMLDLAGFDHQSARIGAHTLPESVAEVSPDVKAAAEEAHTDAYSLPILYTFSATRP